MDDDNDNLLDVKVTVSLYDILSQVSQEDIIERFLNIRIDTRFAFRSPFRKDKNPTCNFKYFNGKLLFRDWSESKSLDCFDIVQRVYNCDYEQCLQIIAKSFSIKSIDLSTTKQINDVYINRFDDSKEKSNKEHFTVESFINFQNPHFKYLSSFGITKKQIDKFKVVCIYKIYKNKKLFYTANKFDPCIGYFMGHAKNSQRWKFYFYNRNRVRFMSNTNRIQGWVQLPKNDDLLIITKSLKDVMFLDTFGISAIAPPSENFIFYKEVIDSLKLRFDKIVVMYDNDRVGMEYAEKLYNDYQIPYIITPEKDITDTYKIRGKNETKNFIENNILI